MKRFVVFLLCIILSVVSFIPVFAENETEEEANAGTLLAINLLKYYRYETDQITLAVSEAYTDWEKYLGNDPDDILYTLMYQVYYLNMKDVVSAYDNDGSFGKNISERYYWVVPNYEKGSEVQVVRNDDTKYGWAIRRGTHFMKSIDFSYKGTVFGIAAIYDNILTKCPNVDKTSFRLVYDEVNDMHLMYFTSEESEYVVPYFASKEITWLTNAEVYSAKEYIELIRTNTTDDTSNIDLGEGKLNTETIYLNYIVIGTLTVAGVALIAIVLAQKKKNQ